MQQLIFFMLNLSLYDSFFGNMERQTRKHLVTLLKRQINLVVRNEGKLGFHGLSGICTFLELLGIIASYGNHQWINI